MCRVGRVGSARRVCQVGWALWALSLGLLAGTILAFGGWDAASAASSSEALLWAADQARGLAGGSEVVTISIDTESKSGTDHATIEVFLQRDEAAGLRQVVRFLAPKRMVGQVFLVAGNSTWMYQPGLKRPIRISAQQKLFGDAGIAEAAGLEFGPNYRIDSETTESAPGGALRRLDLAARTPDVPYQKAALYLDPQTGRVVRSVLASPSGQPLKTLTYDRYAVLAGRQVVTRLTVQNELTKGSRSVLTIVGVEDRELPDQLFRPEFLHQVELLGRK